METPQAVSRDQDLLRSTWLGDAEAFRALVAIHEREVRRIAACLCNSPAGGDALAAAVFLRLLRRVDRLQNLASIRPWLMRTTTHLCLSRQRRAGEFREPGRRRGRAIRVLREAAGLRYEEIASLLTIPTDAVLAELRRERRRALDPPGGRVDPPIGPISEAVRCIEVVAWIDAFVDDELASLDREKIEAHLRQCAGCSDELQRIRAEVEAFRAELQGVVSPPEPDEAFHDRALGAAQREAAVRSWVLTPQDAEEGRAAGPFRGRRLVRPLVWVGLLALAAWVVLEIGSPPFDPVLDAPAPSTAAILLAGLSPAPEWGEIAAELGSLVDADPGAHGESAIGIAPNGRMRASGSLTFEESEAVLQAQMLLSAERSASLPDTAWTRRWQEIARSLAVGALRSPRADACRLALLAYWRMAHRDGRSLYAAAETVGTLYTGDRVRIAALLRCAD